MIEAKEKKPQIPSLYELTSDLQALMDFGYSEEDEQTFMDTLEGIMGGIQDKADGYCAVITQLDSNVNMIKAEEERLAARRTVIENNISHMKEALKHTLEVMEAGGIKKPTIKTDLHTIRLAGNGGLQPMTIDEEKVPENYKIISYETDKQKIRKELEAGKKLPFAHLEPRGRHITGIK